MIMNDLMLYFNLGMVLIVVVFALWGLFAGFKREIKCFIGLLVLLGIAWIIFGNGSVLLDYELPQSLSDSLASMLGVDGGTLREIAITFLREKLPDMVPGITLNFAEGTRAYALAMSVMEGLARMVSLLVGTIFVLFFLAPLIRFITFIIGLIIKGSKKRRAKKASGEIATTEVVDEEASVVVTEVDGQIKTKVVVTEEKPKKQGKMRLAGAGIGALRGLLFVLLICTPLTGILSVVKDVEESTLELVPIITEADQGEQVYLANGNSGFDIQAIIDLAKAYDKSFMRKISGLGLSLDEKLFDSWTKIETKNSNIYLRQELERFVDIANAVSKDFEDGIDIWKLGEEAFATLEEQLPKSVLIQELLPVAIEIALDQDIIKGPVSKSNIDTSGLFEIDWEQDLPKIIRAAKHALELGNPTDEDFNFLDLDSDVLNKIVSELGSTEFITKVMPIAVNVALNLDAVKDFLGDVGTINFDGINWREELLLIVDIYTEFKKLGITDLKDINLMDLLNDMLTDETKYATIQNIINKFANSVIFKNLLPSIGDAVLETQIPEVFKGIISIKDILPENLKDDILVLLSLAKDAAELGILDGNPDLKATERFKEMVSKILSLHLVDGKLTELATAALTHFDLFDMTNVDLSNVNWKDEETNIHQLIDVYAEIIKLDGVNVDDFNNIQFDIMKLLDNNLFIDYILDILEIGEKSKLITNLLPSIINDIALKQLPDDLDEIFDEDDFNDSLETINEIKNILEIVHRLSELNVFGEGDIDFANTDAMKEIITRFFDSKYIKDREARLIKIIGGYIDKDDKIDFDSIDLSEVVWRGDDLNPGEREHLIKIIDILSPILQEEGFKLPPEDIKQYITDDNLELVAQIIEVVASSDLILNFLPVIVDTFVVDLLPEEFRFVADLENVSKEALAQDFMAIAAIVRNGIELGLAEVYHEGIEVLDLTNLAPVQDVIQKVLNLNIISGKEAELIKTLLEQLEIDTTDIDFDHIQSNWQQEVDLIVAIIGKVEEIIALEEIEITTYADIEPFIEKVTEDIIGFLTDNVAYSVIDLVNLVLDSQILKEVLPNAYEKFVLENLDADLQPIADLADIDKEVIISDLKLLLGIAKDAIDLGVIGILDGEDINYSSPHVTAIITKLFSLELLQIKLVDIIDFVDDQLADFDLSKIDAREIDLKADGELLASVYTNLLVILEDAVFPIKNKDFSFDNIDFQELLDAYLVEDTVNKVIEALRDLTSTTILRQALPIALDFAKDLVPADLAFIVEYEGLTKDDLIADVKSVVEVLQQAVNLGAIDVYLTEDADITNLEPLKDIVERLFNLNLLQGKYTDAIKYALELLGADVNNIDFDSISFEHERDLIL
ncbi:MAG TPA: hypothetical protein GXZ35_04040, partial [Acholeplasmataceae bacterium]|nr:hypothetical protein [Acholeplasmataceae bacterium]